MVRSMSTNAQAILEQIKALPPETRREVFSGLEGILRADDAAKAAQRAAITQVHGMFAGSPLWQALLDEHVRENGAG